MIESTVTIQQLNAAAAQNLASQTAQRETANAKNIANIIANGQPSQGPNSPGVTPSDFAAAYGLLALAQSNLRVAAANCTDPAKLAAGLAALA